MIEISEKLRIGKYSSKVYSCIHFLLKYTNYETDVDIEINSPILKTASIEYDLEQKYIKKIFDDVHWWVVEKPDMYGYNEYVVMLGRENSIFYHLNGWLMPSEFTESGVKTEYTEPHLMKMCIKYFCSKKWAKGYAEILRMKTHEEFWFGKSKEQKNKWIKEIKEYVGI